MKKIIDSQMKKIIGERIKARRNALDITQKQIFDLTRISTGNQSSIENGINLPSTTALLKLSKVLECSIDWLLTGKGTIASEGVDLNISELDLIKMIRSLDVDNQEDIYYLTKLKYQRVEKEPTE